MLQIIPEWLLSAALTEDRRSRPRRTIAELRERFRSRRQRRATPDTDDIPFYLRAPDDDFTVDDIPARYQTNAPDYSDLDPRAAARAREQDELRLYDIFGRPPSDPEALRRRASRRANRRALYSGLSGVANFLRDRTLVDDAQGYTVGGEPANFGDAQRYQNVADFVARMGPTEEDQDRLKFIDKLEAGATSFIPLLAAGTFGGWPAAGLLGATMGADEIASAIPGAIPEQRLLAMQLGAPAIGAMEGLVPGAVRTLGRPLRRAGTGLLDRALHPVGAQLARNTGRGFAGESTTEFAQNQVPRLAAQQTGQLDEPFFTREHLAQSGEEGLIGGIVGGNVNLVGTSFGQMAQAGRNRMAEQGRAGELRSFAELFGHDPSDPVYQMLDAYAAGLAGTEMPSGGRRAGDEAGEARWAEFYAGGPYPVNAADIEAAMEDVEIPRERLDRLNEDRVQRGDEPISDDQFRAFMAATDVRRAAGEQRRIDELPADQLDRINAERAEVGREPLQRSTAQHWEGRGPRDGLAAYRASLPEGTVVAPPIHRGASEYMAQSGVEGETYVPPPEPNQEFHDAMADAYFAAPHAPRDPQVRAAYQAFTDETAAQFRQMTEGDGIRVVFTERDPYDNAADMMQDVLVNKTLKVFTGGEPHALMTNMVDTPSGPQSINNVFRAVHDYYGHAHGFHGFETLRGEEGAYRRHSTMYSPEARRAMAVETRGQTSAYYRSGRERAFPEQKATLLPPEFSQVTYPDESGEARIAEAASRFGGVVRTGPIHDLIDFTDLTGGSPRAKIEHGFVDEDGQFLTRQEAEERALRIGQIRPEDRMGPELVAEDITARELDESGGDQSGEARFSGLQDAPPEEVQAIAAALVQSGLLAGWIDPNDPTLTGEDVADLVEAAAEQHGLDDVDNPNREAEDISEAQSIISGLLGDQSGEARFRATPEDPHGMIAQWIAQGGDPPSAYALEKNRPIAAAVAVEMPDGSEEFGVGPLHVHAVSQIFADPETGEPLTAGVSLPESYMEWAQRAAVPGSTDEQIRRMALRNYLDDNAVDGFLLADGSFITRDEAVDRFGAGETYALNQGEQFGVEGVESKTAQDMLEDTIITIAGSPEVAPALVANIEQETDGPIRDRLANLHGELEDALDAGNLRRAADIMNTVLNTLPRGMRKAQRDVVLYRDALFEIADMRARSEYNGGDVEGEAFFDFMDRLPSFFGMVDDETEYTRLYRLTRPGAPVNPNDPASRTGREGAEGDRRKNYGQDYIPRLPFYVGEATPEHLIADLPERVEARIPTRRLYDIVRDPENFVENRGHEFTLAEQDIRDAGYAGIINPAREQAWLFEEPEVTWRGAAGTPQAEARGTGVIPWRDALTNLDSPAGELATQIADATVDGGGATVALDGSVPAKKYRYRTSQAGTEVSLPFDGTVDPAHIEAFIRANRDALTQQGNYLGTWVNKEDGRVYLDVSRAFDKQGLAVDYAAENGQVAIWDDAGKRSLRLWPEGEEVPADVREKHDKIVYYDPTDAGAADRRARLDTAIPERAAARETAWRAVAAPHEIEWFEGSNSRNQRLMLEEFSRLVPQTADLVKIAQLGMPAFGWYLRSGDAIMRMVPKGPDGADQARFAYVLAAFSPNAPVPQNTTAALHFWNSWTQAGRPTSEADIAPMIDAAAEYAGAILPAYSYGKDGKVKLTKEGDPVRGAPTGNLLRVVSADPRELLFDNHELLSGLKVDAFGGNIIGETVKGTMDTHMGRGTNVADPSTITRNLAMQAVLRAAARELGGNWDITNVQETAWQVYRAINELAGRGKLSEALFNEDGELDIPTYELILEAIAEPSDFSAVLSQPQNLPILEELGWTPPDPASLPTYSPGTITPPLDIFPPEGALRRTAERMDLFNKR